MSHHHGDGEVYPAPECRCSFTIRVPRASTFTTSFAVCRARSGLPVIVLAWEQQALGVVDARR
jgi:hypothetical protein